MLVAIDVQYDDHQSGYYGLVGFENWPDEDAQFIESGVVCDCAEYQPGEFFKRELPVLQVALGRLDNVPEIVVVDGHVDLETTRPGLGRYLYEAYQERIVVIGVAKNKFGQTDIAIEVARGASNNPLFVSSAGMDSNRAAACIRSMAGPFRIPKLLKLADRIARETASGNSQM